MDGLAGAIFVMATLDPFVVVAAALCGADFGGVDFAGVAFTGSGLAATVFALVLPLPGLTSFDFFDPFAVSPLPEC